MQIGADVCLGTIPDWLTAIGTIGAVLVALFWKSIKQWLNRPKINISCKASTPCVEVISGDNQSSSPSKEIRLRVKLVNTGNYIATNCLLIIDSYYSLRRDGVYVLKEFTPKQMLDYQNSNISFVAPHLNYFYDIISICQYDTFKNADDAGSSKQFYKPAIIGRGKPIELSKGTYIIPLKFYSSKLPTQVTYLRLFWDSDQCDTDKKSFDYSIISDSDFKLLKKS